MQRHLVLVIEDNLLFRENLASILELEGFKVLSAANGLAGIALATQHLPALILCDIMMPELDGYGVLEALGNNPETAIIPFIFITAKSSSQDIRHGMHLGVNDYITKPYTIEDVRATVRAQLKKWDRIHQVQQQTLVSLQTRVEQLAQAAHYDALTQILNRRGLEHILEQEMPRFQRYPCPLSIVLCDIDHFKGVNDTHGHAKGDEILANVAQILQRQVRESDLLCRWGGEEFLIVAPGLAEDMAFELAERLRKSIALYFQHTPIPVTLSLGVAALDSGQTHLGDCLEQADLALYRAKQQGRNQSQKATALGPSSGPDLPLHVPSDSAPVTH